MMEVELKHGRNPDIPGGYWQEPKESGKARRVVVKDLKEAATVCVSYIEDNGLGYGNWDGGKVRDNGKEVARVSYNGSVWGPGPWKHGAKPLAV